MSPHNLSFSDLLMQRADGASFWARTRSERSPASSRAASGIFVTIDEIDDLVMDVQAQIDAIAPVPLEVAPATDELERRILVIDDDRLVLNATARVLSRMGYEIASFTEPRDALQEFSAAPGTFDAVITDFQMPGLNGLQLSERLIALRHDVPILLTSAFLGEIDLMLAKQIGVERVIPKPLSSEELAIWLVEVVSELPRA